MTDRPEPVLAAGRQVAAITALLSALATVAVTLGVLTQTDADTLLTSLTAIAGAVLTIANVVLPLWHATRVRELVTPVASPQDAAGRRLLPEPTPPITSSGTGHNVTLSKPPPDPTPPPEAGLTATELCMVVIAAAVVVLALVAVFGRP